MNFVSDFIFLISHLSRKTTIFWRLLRLPLLAYLILILVFSQLQESLLFPGTGTQGQKSAVIHPFKAGGEMLLHLTSADGTNLVARFAPARLPDGTADPDANTRPTLIFFYGNGMSAADCAGFAEWFPKALGVNLVIPDYPGYGMSGGAASERSFRAAEDAIYDRLLAMPEVDPKQLIPVGWSLGGGSAVDLASRRPVAGLMTFSAFTSVRAMGREMLPWLPTSLVVRHEFDNAAKLPSITAPTFVAHGRSDGTIPFTMRDQLAAAAGGPVTTFSNDAGHNDFFDVEPKPRPLPRCGRGWQR